MSEIDFKAPSSESLKTGTAVVGGLLFGNYVASGALAWYSGQPLMLALSAVFGMATNKFLNVKEAQIVRRQREEAKEARRAEWLKCIVK